MNILADEQKRFVERTTEQIGSKANEVVRRNAEILANEQRIFRERMTEQLQDATRRVGEAVEDRARELVEAGRADINEQLRAEVASTFARIDMRIADERRAMDELLSRLRKGRS